MKRTKGTAGRYKLRYVPGNVLRRVVLIFAALYLASMGLATALVRQQFRQDHQRSLSDIADMINRGRRQGRRDHFGVDQQPIIHDAGNGRYD